MSGFDAAWLALREPADLAARDGRLLDAARGWLLDRPGALVLDLGAGTGATVRAIGAGAARWRLLDNDEDLLDEARRIVGPSVETVQADLADVANLPMDDARLVTASALFDLTGSDWIDRLAGRIASRRAGLYAALTYDGRMKWEPADADDVAVVHAFNRHQRKDKGLGPALGPQASARLREAMRARGYDVWLAPSPWRLDSDKAALQGELLKGIAGALHETGFDAEPWLSRRSSRLDDTVCTIGHLDLLALPRDR